jgi:hypothetical protein
MKTTTIFFILAIAAVGAVGVITAITNSAITAHAVKMPCHEQLGTVAVCPPPAPGEHGTVCLNGRPCRVIPPE